MLSYFTKELFRCFSQFQYNYAPLKTLAWEPSHYPDLGSALGRFPFNKNFGLKFRKPHELNGIVHSGCTDPTQGTARFPIRLILATDRERQLTTAPANQTTGLTNATAANWAPEVEFSAYRALSRRQMTKRGGGKLKAEESYFV